MADSRTIQINLKAVSDFNDVAKNAKEIQNALSKIKIPENLKGTFAKIFGDIEKSTEKAAQAMSNGFKSKGDVSSFEKSVNSVNVSMEKLYQTIQKIDKDGLGFGSYDADIRKLDTQIEVLQKKLQNLAKVHSDAVHGVASNAPSKAQSWAAFAEAFDAGKIDEAERALKRLQQQQDKVTHNQKEYKDGVAVYTKALEAMKGKGEEATKTTEELNKALKDQENLKAQGTKEVAQGVENIGNAARQSTVDVDKLGRSTLEVAKRSAEVNTELDHFKSRIAYFFGAQNAVNLFKRALQSAFATVKDLDAVMTETAVVTKFDVGDMWKQLPEYTKRANELGVSIHSAYEAATIYYQQGLETNQVMEVSNQTLKMARIAGLDAAEATDRMTNALRGFNMEINELNAERVADVYSKLAAMSASNVDEISTAMTKVASLASNANMEFETTAAFLAQVIETTRESAETAGTALKTVIARFSEVKKLYSTGELLGTDEEGEAIDVNKVSKALRTAGVDLNEYLTGMKGLDDIFIELASKWDNLDQIQQRYIATMAAGSRQQSRFIAMMQDYGRTQQLVSAAENASGASQEQYQKTLESLETKLNRLKNAWNEFVMGIANNSLIKAGVDLLTNFINAINKLTSSLPGAIGAVAKLGIAFGAFKIGKGLFNKGLAQAGQVFMKGTTDIANKGSANFVDTFKAGVQKKFGEIKGIKGVFKPLEQEAEVTRERLQSALLKESVTGDFSQRQDILATFDSEGADAAINQAHELGYALEELDTDTANAKQQMAYFDKGLSSVSTTMMAAGGAFIMIAQILDKLGANKAVVKVFMGIGTALMLVGTLLPVVSKGIEALGIKTAAAGLIAQKGWGWIGMILTIVAAAIGAVVAIVSSLETTEQKLDRLEDSAKKASDAASDMTQKYEDLKDSLDELGNKESNLEKLTVGTQAWRDAVMDVNKQVLELINNYPKLISYVRSENGVLSLDYEGAAQALEEYNQLAIETQKAALYTNAVAVKGKAESERGNVLKSGNIEITGNAYGRGIDVNSKIDQLSKALAGDQGAIKALGFNPKDSDNLGQYINQLSSDFGILIDSTDESISALTRYGQTLLEAETEISALIPALIDSKVANEEYADGVKNFLSDGFLADQLDKSANRKYGQLTGDEKAEFKNYFKDIYGDNFKKIKAGGKVELDDGTIIEASDAMNRFVGAKAGEIVDPIVNEFVNKISNSKDAVAEVIQSFYEKGGGGSLTKSDLSILEGVNLEEKLKELGLSEEVITQVLSDLTDGINLSEDTIANLKENVKQLGFTTTTVVGGFEELTGSAIVELFNNIKEIEQESGIDAGLIIRDKYNAIAKELEPEEVTKFGEALSMIDWNDIDSIEDLPSILEDLGVNTENIEGPLGDLISSIIKLGNASSRTAQNIGETTANTVKSTGKILSDLRSGKADRSFTEEEYNTLKDLMPEIADQFTMDADGNWIYLGNSMSALQTAVEQNTAALIEGTRQELENKIAGADAWEQLATNSPNHMAEANAGNEEAQAWMLDRFIKQNQGNLDSLGIQGLSNETTAKKLVDNGTVEQVFQALVDLLEQRSANQAQLETTNKSLGYSNLNADQIALMGGSDQQVRQNALTEAQDYGLDTEEILAASEALQKLGVEEQQIADRIALDNARMSASVKELSSNWDEWKEGLGAPETTQYSQSLAALQKNMKGLLGISSDLRDEFITDAKTMELMEAAANGDLNAIDELRLAAAQDIILHAGLEEDTATQINAELADIVNSVEYMELEIGTSLDQTSFGEGLVDMMNSLNLSVEEMQRVFDSLGWEPDITYTEMPVSDFMQQTQYTRGQVVMPDGTIKEITLENASEFNADDTVQVPVINASGTTYKGSAPRTTSPSSRPKSSGGGGGGGGGKEEKPTYWENPYDELYNLTEKINEALRERERLERRYQKIAQLSVTTAGEMRQAFTDQIEQLEREIDLQKQLEAGRLRQIKNIGNQIYTDSEGNRSTFSQLGVTKYANYNEKTGLIQIDWNAIEAVSRDPNRSEEGEAIEAYISKLEELVQGYEEIRDTIWDMQDEVEDLIQEAIDSYLDFEDRVFNALVEERQKEIDSFEKISDAIDNATSRVLDKMEKQIEQERQNRENDKTEEEIADKEARLAYLSRDTSGANAMEIMQLQEELEEARQNYTDSLIDQAIQQMRDDADLAAEQRAEQQAVMEAQLEIEKTNGSIMQQAVDLIHEANTALGSEYLMRVLQESDGYKNMSEIGKEKWTNDFVEQWNKAQSAYDALQKQKAAQAASAAGTASGTTSTNSNSSASSNNSAPKSKYPLTLTDDIAKGVATSICLTGGSGWGNGQDRINRITEKFGAGAYDKIQGYVDQIAWSGWKNLYSKNGANYTYYAFKKGGLANFTGPAWLDGSRSNPEMVLNALKKLPLSS